MKNERSATVNSSGGRAVVLILASFPIACFTCALFTDIAYVRTMQVMWADFSDWLLAVGMAGGVIAAVGGLLELLVHRNAYRARPVWPVLLGSLVVLIVAFFNNLVHSRDAWTSVMPEGLALSCITVILIIVTVVFASTRTMQRDDATPFGGLRR